MPIASTNYSRPMCRFLAIQPERYKLFAPGNHAIAPPFSAQRFGGVIFGKNVRNDPMGWATAYIDKLRQGETVQFRPRGNSMAGKIESGQLCTVTPVKPAELEVGDIVLCKVNG